ncbi:Nucleotide-binding universal stress protein, UspA family [Geodermatophilus obscurus]|uniref:Nucleotide-binding universal stress protein, UspA family n=1 Tax=Geodermatophilus obscurus TaxID=1861 RepID=A0A1M7U742_9ACTN|nr:universal stress protein [Geodermatophilus obscurus]SHN78690.1 Nucleotide-binding universal stress protein, UspA family [Geodermatophilus obscurus]
MSAAYWALPLVGWVAAGMVAVVLVLYRRGHRDGSWLLLGAVLGPLILPIAVERARRRPQRLERYGEPGADEATPGGQLCVLIGVDGSPGSEEAVRAALRLVVPVAGRVLLATVVSSDAVDGGRDDELASARDLLSRHRDGLPEGTVAVETQIMNGQPAPALLGLADTEDVDLIVVGRRGKGLSRAVLGSAASRVTTSARCPVLLAPPPDART